jgi:16S rRNA C967 or C1407 C5-methylase (RsmB/RsmF family)
MLKKFSTQHLPLDVFLRNYFKIHKSLGSHDRKFLAEKIYTLFRWLGLVDYLCKNDHSWETRIEIFNSIDLSERSADRSLPEHISVSFPKKLFDVFKAAYGNERARELCLISNSQAPTTIRSNPLKIERTELLNLWKTKYQVEPCNKSPQGIVFKKRENFFGMEEFKQGFFEVQDEGSQLVAFLVDAKPGQQVLDYCSGSGGKTLAFAPNLCDRGQIYLHDIRPHALMEAKKRLKRAGIQNAQLLYHEDVKKKNLKNRMDWVLVDAPCSGTGTLRRNPDMKWKFDPDTISQIQHEQRVIFSEALEFVKPEGKIVFATCSILPQENVEQLNYFLENHPLELLADPLEIYPTYGGMDGFYGVVFQKKKDSSKTS